MPCKSNSSATWFAPGHGIRHRPCPYHWWEVAHTPVQLGQQRRRNKVERQRQNNQDGFTLPLGRRQSTWASGTVSLRAKGLLFVKLGRGLDGTGRWPGRPALPIWLC